MILKTAANYNDEGGYIEAWKNSDGTTEVKLIPKSGGDEGKNGLLSVTISPAITTTPAYETKFPIYYEDLTADEISAGKSVWGGDALFDTSATYTATVTPTADWYAAGLNGQTFGGKGEPITEELTFTGDSLGATFILTDTLDQDDPNAKHFRVIFSIDYYSDGN